MCLNNAKWFCIEMMMVKKNRSRLDTGTGVDTFMSCSEDEEDIQADFSFSNRLYQCYMENWGSTLQMPEMKLSLNV